MKPHKLKTDIEQELTEIFNDSLDHEGNEPKLVNLVHEVTEERDSFWQQQLILSAILDYIFEHLSEINRLEKDIPNLKEKILMAVQDEYSKTSIEELQNSLKN
ncbi:conserved hypothetical protein [Gloeothece citriformis PCC 7424]|uniref:Uncharacterized protein n=1 Tax=Gloeothece citriformis (strain PCC 7424) TaxID=65393 RepID=B7K9S4_GLOC7|nr:hypothetical protein [Gloeothece citriformis]ACK70042.1 conserved hypothetical protein [Gloeothece citriformis PCC 7424]